MLLLKEYKDDMLEHLRAEPEKTFTDTGKHKAEILNDKDTVERLWTLYQKAAQEYNVPPYRAFREALSDVCGIPEPDTYDDSEKDL